MAEIHNLLDSQIENYFIFKYFFNRIKKGNLIEKKNV